MNENDPLDGLRGRPAPQPTREARQRALEAALRSYDENFSAAPQGSPDGKRQTGRISEIWRGLMQRKLAATPAIAGLVALPIAGYAAWHLMGEGSPFGPALEGGAPPPVTETQAPARQKEAAPAPKPEVAEEREIDLSTQLAARPEADQLAAQPNAAAPVEAMRSAPMPAPAGTRMVRGLSEAQSKLSVLPPEPMPPEAVSQDRLQAFDTNPVRLALESPVSTFSIDVDTASYSYVRSVLKSGVMPNPDSVRVEEMINYFPYDWKGPDAAATPFNTTVSVMPTPWNEHTQLMHVAIKGYDVQPAQQPAANLVFLIDTSGSMNAPDKLPLLKSAFRLLVNQLSDADTVSIVTYAGSAGVALEPTRGSDRAKILAALDNLGAEGSTAGEAGLKEAYRLAESSFVKDGVNRIMLATDGDFNVGPSSDEELKTLIEAKRKDGVFLSVFGFGRGNLNDQLMQTIAQNGNGTAAYIDTLAEAEKVLVQESRATLFPIAKDVKIQVEFNPSVVSEYRLIGYETRALKREDFNNDRVDAGEIGSGHSVTAIYEITPKGSPAQMMDDLRYGAGTDKPAGDAAAGAHGGEYAFVKIRYKLPGEDASKLIETPVTKANEVASFGQASADQRFSVAVAAFGQKLRDTDATATFDYDRIMEIATAARGSDPFGYRAEFLSLVRLASALDGKR
jgi:Ca-activated chloride channel family protein